MFHLFISDKRKLNVERNQDILGFSESFLTTDCMEITSGKLDYNLHI